MASTEIQGTDFWLQFVKIVDGQVLVDCQAMPIKPLVAVGTETEYVVDLINAMVWGTQRFDVCCF